MLACIRGLAAVILLVGGASADPGGAATEAVRSTINEVIRVLKDAELKKPGRAEERRRLLEKVIGDRFNYEEMARRALGAQWNKLSDKERQEFVDLFKGLLSGTYTDKIEGYSGEQVHYLNERLEADYAEVRTKVASDKTEIPLDYRLLNKSGDWRVYDVVVDGVSLVNNYRSQFTKIIRESSYADLLEKLREKSKKKSEQPQAP
ncbi:MAG: organic solvent tolerance ABC transporter substrate-binding protein [Nitrospirae bacterium 13_1_40CM_62_7]|nr:MAG: organic solvent tolerance ABC transporter substrate-binding protein [Nitrospirae bacterium 13_2_20CM_62_7]OLB57887.1 MAG: organic solvent tolerance ABC transporter substrate-binding protein [Nitrospirae bacterium 13_2_20CM_2_62_8]OLC01566.1 MAG: organic solvent tolerance ABC transporter substrate-binding protein [Nitrospirae bacterium 13_1_40CM_62_7]OLC43239.1 MAG: organic solvent tolerance ABC transporter substrate-binding protein [Nitrospirae bacterium 13_1_40CM_4_62_6]OLD37711.1 MAG: